jgi:hypothetical protein
MVYFGGQALIVGVRASPATYQLTQLTALDVLYQRSRLTNMERRLQGGWGLKIVT